MRSTTAPLTAAEMELLEFERTTWKYLGAKEGAVLERFGLTLPQYTQRLFTLIEKPAALAYDPAHVTRLRRQRDQHATSPRARARRDGIEVAQ